MISNAQIVSVLVDAAGTATSYFHRLLNEIIDTLNGQSGQSGTAAVIPNGSGVATIPHGFQISGHPASLGQCSVYASGTTAFHVQLVSVSSSILTVKLFDMAGVALTSGSWPIVWKVAG